MQTQIFLIAPADAQPAALAAQLGSLLDQHEASALLLPRGTWAENAYKDFVRQVLPVAQAAGCAVLVEGAPGLVRMLGADGLHIPDADVEATQEAVAALRPGLIVGVGGIASRDDAMTLGELDVDYVLFGAAAGPARPSDRELARWWAETMEIPSVLSDPEAGPANFDAGDCEFIGLPLTLPEPTK